MLKWTFGIIIFFSSEPDFHSIKCSFESFFNYLKLGEKVADAFRLPSVLIESTANY